MWRYADQRGVNVKMNRGCFNGEIRRWLLTTVAVLSSVAVSAESGGILATPTMAAEWQPLLAQAGQNTGAAQSEGQVPVALGMGKEAIRQVWGAPEEVRKIRTCFGWQEEWVYRGDAKRFGASERVLLFDEGELLTEIK
jgi:hypothetical protein